MANFFGKAMSNVRAAGNVTRKTVDDAFKDVGAFKALGVLAAGGLAADTVADPIIQNVKVEMAKRKMMDLTPSLKNESEEDIKNYFSVIKTFSPKAASNPLVAGALVNKMVQFGGVDHKLVQDLAKIDKDATKASPLASIGLALGSL